VDAVLGDETGIVSPDDPVLHPGPIADDCQLASEDERAPDGLLVRVWVRPSARKISRRRNIGLSFGRSRYS
jgi:hypothetical protein